MCDCLLSYGPLYSFSSLQAWAIWKMKIIDITEDWQTLAYVDLAYTKQK